MLFKFVSKIQVESIQNQIYCYRGFKVLLDSDLASIYGVETRVLNQAVARNKDRFPEDFAFILSIKEWENLKSQIVISSSNHGGRRKSPYVFTEQGVAMLSSVLNSKDAIKANIQIMRIFVSIRNIADSYKELESRINRIESKPDEKYRLLVRALLELKEKVEPGIEKNRKKIGL